MAELALQVVVSPLLGVIFDKLSSPLIGEFDLLRGVQEDLETLSLTASTVHGVLQDAKAKQNTHPATAIWLAKLKDAAYEADDIIDECKTRALFSLHSRVHNGSCSTQVCNSLSTYFNIKHLLLRHKIANKIKAVRKRFDVIAEEGNKFQLITREIERGPVENFTQYRETSSELLEEFVYGRDVDKEKIVTSLLNNASSKDNLLVYTVIGMGGLGKTTLTQYVYNDTSIVKNFHTRIWICVSEDFRADKLTKMIIESYSREKCDLTSLEDLQNRLKELLGGKKFLLILDDVWNEDQGKWDKLQFPLKCGAKGSSIIVTTRLSSVAQIMGAPPMNQYKLGPLSDEECWALFKRRAFEEEDLENLIEFERIGKEIVKKCRGVPLAAKALGGSLRLVRELNEWKAISSSTIWELGKYENDGGILSSLRLSYNGLSARLRECFAFCSIFPKDHRINMAELIQLWMANGLLQPEGTLDLEDVGRRTFNELVWRSFLQDVEKQENGEKTCKMHDFMHDLACFVAENECLSFDGGVGKVAELPKNIRHLSMCLDYKSKWRNILKCLGISHPFLRTFFQIRKSDYDRVWYKIVFKSLRCLRVLDLSGNHIKYIPESIGKMKHLRYLDFSHTNINHLPLSLCDLLNLQTLKLRYCGKLKRLPANMNNLVNLIHLDLYGCYGLTQMPVGIGEWVRLRTLGAFFVGSENGQSIRELGKLAKLGGEMEIHRLEHVRDATEARAANLAAKTNLLSVDFGWTLEQENAEEVLEALQPHQNLSGCLFIDGYGGSRFPSWILNLKKLCVIRLSDCSKCGDLPPIGDLPLLKKVEIKGMDSLKRINKEFYGTGSSKGVFFPSLAELSFMTMPNWEEWEAVDDKEAFPCLTKLSFLGCPKLTSIPCTNLSSLKDLSVIHCKEFTVASLPCLRSLHLGQVDSIPVGSLLNLDALESLELIDCSFSSLPQQIQHLPSLKSLRISFCDALTSVSQFLQHLPSLESLTIQFCDELEFSIGDFHHLLSLQSLILSSLPKLTSLPDLQHLPNLQSLDLTGLPKLTSLPDLQHLPSLKSLRIYACDALTSVSQFLQHLPSLESLTISGCYKLEFSIADFHHLLSLQSLILYSLPKLTSLPDLQHLPNLQSLTIWECDNLRVLPQSMQNLTSLHTLEILGCHHDLPTRCEEGKGEYWPYISHVPHLIIKESLYEE